MDVRAIQDDLLAWVRAQGLPCHVEDAPQVAVTFPHALLAGPHVIQQVGEDWVQDADGVDDDDVPFTTPTVVGNRELLFSLRVINRSHTTAQGWCERLRASLKFPAVLATFAAANIAIVRVGKTTRIAPETLDGRVESVASVDLRIATTIAYTGPSGGIIETIALSSTVEDPGGDVLPSPPNLVDEIIG